MDDGFDARHPALADAFVPSGQTTPAGEPILGKQFKIEERGYLKRRVHRSEPITPSTNLHRHGTAVASVLEGTGEPGATGHGIPIVPVGTGPMGGLSHFARGVDYLLERRAQGDNIRVVNFSMGYPYGGPSEGNPWLIPMNRLRDADMLVVASSGNTGNVFDPAQNMPAGIPLDNVVSVGWLDQAGERLHPQSERGPGVHIAAVGENLPVAEPDFRWGFDSGASFATPQVSAAAARWFDRNPGASATEARAALMDTADALPALKGLVESGALNEGRLLR